ncbi:MAG: type II secretion system F family protein [Gemmatimonadetes bacterium]|nr:type II secretion system F family protein [Gemmatimonadota bacterium]
MFDILPPNWLPALLVFLTAGLGVISIAFMIESGREVKRRRDFRRQLEGVTKGPTVSGSGPASILRDDAGREFTWLEPILRFVPQTSDLRLLLEQADVNWSVGSFLIICIGLGFAMGSAAWILGGSPIYFLIFGGLGSVLPLTQLRRLRTKRLRAFEEAFPEAIDLLGRSIRAGHAFATGMKVVAEEGQEPVAGEFRQVFEEQKFGLPLDESLLGLADRIELVDVRIFVTAILVQRDVGGNLAEILDKISYTIRERFMIQRQIRVYSAQGRLTGYLLAALPILVGVLIYTLNSEYMSILFEEPIGRAMIAMAILLQLVGFFFIRRIVDIEI